MKKPCKECPFKKDSTPGYLGNLSHQPQQFLNSTEYNMMTCHMSVNQDDEGEDILIEETGTPCIGALQFMNNSCKFPRGAREPGDYQKALDTAGTNPNVFKWSAEFINHHS